MLKKIALTGPESTGKSTLCQQLATHYQTVFVPEYARTYIDEIDRPYQYDDILQIAKGQWQMEQKRSTQAHHLLFSDTELLVTKIWCEYVYGQCHEWILEHLKKQDYALYLLLDIDIQWVMDSQREYPSIDLRREIFNLYQENLVAMGVNFLVIRGNYKERFAAAVQAIDRLVK